MRIGQLTDCCLPELNIERTTAQLLELCRQLLLESGVPERR